MNPITPFLSFVPVVASIAASLIVAMSIKVANVWQKFVILRLGKLQSVRGAGIFAIIPVAAV